MATYPVEIRSESRWCVFHATTDTLFLPTWSDEDAGELCAHMFAAYYRGRADRDYSEAAQLGMARSVHTFLSTHNLLEGSSEIPEFWRKKWDDENWITDPTCEDVYDLVSAFERDGQAAGLFMDEFVSWLSK
jgi:hypothetical protein